MTSIEVPYSIAAALPTLSVMDVTNDVAQTLSRSGRTDGIAYIHATHGRSLVRIQERETGFFEDLEALLERIVPSDVDGRERLVTALLAPRSEQVPFQRGLALPRTVPANPALLARRGAPERMDADPARMTPVARPRTRQRLLAGLALGLVALIAELAGRSLTHRLDVGRRVGRVSYAHADYYPFLLAGVKIAVALMLAAARVARRQGACRRARGPARSPPRSVFGRFAARRACGSSSRARLWLLSFVVTASIYLVQADAEQIAGGSWHLLGPWLHSSALYPSSPCSRSSSPSSSGRWSSGSPTTRSSPPTRSSSCAGSRRVHARRAPLALLRAARAALALRPRVRIASSAASPSSRARSARGGTVDVDEEEEP